MLVNIKSLKPGWEKSADFVYIGRSGKGFKGPFGNPIRLETVCPVCDEKHYFPGETFDCYEKYLRNRLDTNPKFKAQFLVLKGKILVCFCKPKPCHGEVILKVLNESC